LIISTPEIRSILKKCRRLNYWATAVLLLGLVPLLKRFNLPVNFNWAVLGAFYLLLSMQAIFLAVLLCLLGFEPKKTFGPMLRQFKDGKLRILPVLAFLLVLCVVLPWRIALVLTVDTVALLEFFHRIPSGAGRIAMRSVMLPALYLLIGWVLVFAYNDIIVSARFFAAKDAAFNSMDMWLLHGVSVSQICHWAVRTFPISFFRFLEIIYLGMFPLLGAGLILVSICDGMRQGLKFVGTVILPSYIALVLFYFWTSQGPYYLCPIHFTDFPSTLKTYALQRGSIDHARARWEHAPLDHLSTDYFIAFPCVHISAPLIVTWFLRRWKRILVFLLTYDALLIVAIILLEWHYVVDVLAGILIAGVAILIVNYDDLFQRNSTISSPA
jgi:PAP2 superfamily